jgi:hypothetical protein
MLVIRRYEFKCFTGFRLLEINLYFGWIWVLAGFVSGAILGVFFFDDHWLGGFGSWRRRIMRLGHISFLGTGLLNLAFFFTVRFAEVSPPASASWLFVICGVTMPTVCFLSAWKGSMRRLFFIPVLTLIAAVTDLLLWRLS